MIDRLSIRTPEDRNAPGGGSHPEDDELCKLRLTDQLTNGFNTDNIDRIKVTHGFFYESSKLRLMSEIGLIILSLNVREVPIMDHDRENLILIHTNESRISDLNVRFRIRNLLPGECRGRPLRVHILSMEVYRGFVPKEIFSVVNLHSQKDRSQKSLSDHRLSGDNTFLKVREVINLQSHRMSKAKILNEREIYFCDWVPGITRDKEFDHLLFDNNSLRELTDGGSSGLFRVWHFY
jgi:hypothetical protein